MSEYFNLQNFSKCFLKEIRVLVGKNNLNRLPSWIRSAKISVGKIKNSNVILIESTDNTVDSFSFKGNFLSDSEFIHGFKPFPTTQFSLNLSKDVDTLIVGRYVEHGKVVFDRDTKIVNELLAYFPVGLCDYHTPTVIVNIFFQYTINDDIISIKFVPLMFFIHDSDICDFYSFWTRNSHKFSDIFTRMEKESGDYYEYMNKNNRSFDFKKDNTITVFGQYGSNKPLLEKICDYLWSKNYHAYVLDELPSKKQWSLEQKVKSWTLYSRFCIMLDNVSSGAYVEIPYLDDSNSSTGILRPKDFYSTKMITESPDNPNLKIFTYDLSPLTVVDELIKWAESRVHTKIEYWKKEYSWR